MAEEVVTQAMEEEIAKEVSSEHMDVDSLDETSAAE